MIDRRGVPSAEKSKLLRACFLCARFFVCKFAQKSTKNRTDSDLQYRKAFVYNDNAVVFPLKFASASAARAADRCILQFIF